MTYQKALLCFLLTSRSEGQRANCVYSAKQGSLTAMTGAVGLAIATVTLTKTLELNNFFQSFLVINFHLSYIHLTFRKFKYNSGN